MSVSSRPQGFALLLRRPAFQQLWVAQLLALTAQNGIHFVQLILIERLTGRSTHIGLMIIAFSLPPVLFAPFAGVVIDRVPKKWIIVLANLLRGGLALSYILLLRLPSDIMLLLAVYGITFLGSTIGVFFNPAVITKIPLVSGEERLIAANSLFNLTVAGSQLLGLLVLAPVAVKLLGLAGAFALMGSLYLVAFGIALRLPRDPYRQPQGITASSGWERTRNEIKEGWRFVVRHRTVHIAMLQLSMIATLIMILSMIAPGFSARVLGLAPEDAILVFAPAGAGMITAIFVLGRWGQQLREDTLRTNMTILIALAFGVLGFISSDYNTLRIPILDLYPYQTVPLTRMVAATAFVLGFGLSGVNITAQTVIQRQTPPILRGRVFAVQFMLANLGGIPPLLAAATLADLLGIPLLMLWVASGCLVVGLISLYSVFRPYSFSEQIMSR